MSLRVATRILYLARDTLASARTATSRLSLSPVRSTVQWSVRSGYATVAGKKITVRIVEVGLRNGSIMRGEHGTM